MPTAGALDVPEGSERRLSLKRFDSGTQQE
jgi:hypothetical protein